MADNVVDKSTTQQISGLFISTIDVTPSLLDETTVPEIQIRESILSPSVETSITMQATIHSGTRKNYDDFQGALLGLQLASPAFPDNVFQFQQNIYRMENRKQVNYQVEEFTLHACDMTVIDNYGTRISKFYKCMNPSDVVTDALSAVGAQVDIENSGPTRDYQASNLYPFQVIAEQADVALTNNDPSFLHYMTSLNGGTHHFRSVKNLTTKSSKYGFIYNEKGMGLQLGDPTNIMYYEFPCDFDILSDIMNGMTIDGKTSTSVTVVNPFTSGGSIVKGKIGPYGGLGGTVNTVADTAKNSEDGNCGTHVEEYASLRQARLSLIQPSNIGMKLIVPFNPILHAGDMIDVAFLNKEIGVLNYGSGNYLIVTLTHNMKAGGYGVTILECVSKTVGDGISEGDKTIAINQLEGKHWTGVIVGGNDNDPDPQKLGRVRVAVPQIMAPNINVKDLPFCQLGSTPNHEGFMSFDRPPQDGTLVNIYYPPGSKSSMRGVVTLVYNGKHNPQDLDTNSFLTNQGWWKAARDSKPAINIVKEIKNIIESNETGVEKVTTELVDKAITTMNERVGLPSNLASQALVELYSNIKNVSTAKQAAVEAISSGLDSLLPGLSFNFNQILSLMPQQLKNQVLGSIPKDVAAGFVNMLNVMSSYDPKSGTNFMQTAAKLSRVNPDTFFAKAAELLTGVDSFKVLEEKLLKIITDPTIADLSSLANQAIEILGPFGKIIKNLNPDGTLSLSVDELVNQAISAFSSSVAGVQTTVGGMLSNSSIIEDLMPRLSVDAQKEFKAAMDKIPKNLSKVLNVLGN